MARQVREGSSTPASQTSTENRRLEDTRKRLALLLAQGALRAVQGARHE
jgi:hypothetical protein